MLAAHRRLNSAFALFVLASVMLALGASTAHAATRPAISAGYVHTVGLKPNGTVVTVGHNGYGAVSVSGWSDIIAVAAGGHTVGLKSDGTVVATGTATSAYGQTNVSAWTDIVAVSAGYYHTVGLKSDGTVVAVGNNEYGQTNVSAWTDIVAISAGYFHTVGLKSDGTVVAVGYNGYGQTNVSAWTDIVAISAGGAEHTVGLKSDGTVVAVGYNGDGQTNVSAWTDIVAVSTGNSHTVGLRSDGTVVAVGMNDYGQTDVSAWTDIVAVSAGYYHTVGLKSDGTVVAVGWNVRGQTNVSAWSLSNPGVADLAYGYVLGISPSYAYTGAGIEPKPVVRLGGVTLLEGADYTVSYSENSTPGAATVTITGAGNYAGTLAHTFLIRPGLITNTMVSVVEPSFTYTGSPIMPRPVVRFSSTTLDEGADYVVSYANNTSAGTASVFVTGVGNYSGTATRTFAITPSAIGSAVVGGIPVYIGYAGQPCTPTPIVTLGNRLLEAGIDYTVSYANNTSSGTASATILGIGNYSGSIERTFQIIAVTPMNTSIYIGRSTTLRAVGGSGTVTWRSSNAKVGTVSSTGVVKGLASGTTTVTATRNGVRTRCVVKVIKYSYWLSLSRSVSSGNGYINATVKSASGKVVKDKLVKFYRDGAYLGSARTNAYGKARIKVKKYRSYRDYKIVVGSTSRYKTTTLSESLSFAVQVFNYSATDLFTTSVYLRAGTYRMTVSGDGQVWASCNGCTASGEGAASVIFKVEDAGHYGVSGISWDDGGNVSVEIDRFL